MNVLLVVGASVILLVRESFAGNDSEHFKIM